MALAIKLAAKGRYAVKANPMVGCVIVKNNKIIASGYHQKFGEAHAEINAINNINGQAHGATCLINLEPCSHYGKTPPCTESIINAGIEKVIIATLDPNPLVCGKGVKSLIKAGIKVKLGLLEKEALELNRGFIKRMTTNMPFVSCKIAMSLDGKTSMQKGESKWISSKVSREDVQLLRASNQVILTGSNTVLMDNPHMTVRMSNITTSPLRVVIDSNNKINNKKLNIFSKDSETLILNQSNSKTLKSGKLDLKALLKNLASNGVNNVLLEAGPKLIGAMVAKNLIDEFIIYSAPILMGSNANSMINLAIDNMCATIKLSIIDIKMLSGDIKITAKIK